MNMMSGRFTHFNSMCNGNIACQEARSSQSQERYCAVRVKLETAVPAALRANTQL